MHAYQETGYRKYLTRLYRYRSRIKNYILCGNREYQPPNDQHFGPKFISDRYGMSTGVEYFRLCFINDAGDIGIANKFTDGDEGWGFMLSATDFRKLALWYIWKWATGEWFGLRRKLFYRDLHKKTAHLPGIARRRRNDR